MTPNPPNSAKSTVASGDSPENPVLAEKHSRIIRPYRRADAETQPPSLYAPYRSTVLRAPRKPLIAFSEYTLGDYRACVRARRNRGER